MIDADIDTPVEQILRARGWIEQFDAGTAVAIINLGYPHELVHDPNEATHPHRVTLWAPEWIRTMMRAGLGKEIPRCLTDADYRITCINGLTASKNLRTSE